ncbi:hypothetical protein D3C75_925550 [compost metagenome]
MLSTKSAGYFRSRFLELVIEEYKAEIDVTKGINQGLSEEVVLQFFGAAVVNTVEWWFRNGMSLPPRVLAEQTGVILDRNFY